MLAATYIGNELDLIGKTALVQIKDGLLFAQFDDKGLGMLAFGWHLFPRSDFEMERQ